MSSPERGKIWCNDCRKVITVASDESREHAAHELFPYYDEVNKVPSPQGLFCGEVGIFVNDAKQSCPACGGDAYIFEIRVLQFTPIIGKCLSCVHTWPIVRGSLAHQAFMERFYGHSK
jgi:hypothetical protein